MRRRFKATRVALTSCAVLSSAVGCLVLTPLDDVPPKIETASGGSSGNAMALGGSGQTSIAGAPVEAGQPPAAGSEPCNSNADCVRHSADEPYRCRPSDHSCVALKNDACPMVYGAADDPNAIYFGAFASLNPAAPDENSIVWAQRLALDELSGDNIGGLPDGPHGARRPLVMIVCDNTGDMVEPGVKHLAEEVEVPAVIATLKPGDLRRAFEQYRARDIFYFSPVSVTSTISTEQSDRHIWSLLGQPSDFAPSYAELLKLSESHVRAVQHLDPGTPIRVALVTTPDAFDFELAGSLTPVLRFNGMSVSDNGENFASFTIPSKPDFSQMAQDIADFRPDIIISAASEQFLMTGGLEDQLESDWEADTASSPKPRPFYILSPYNAGNLSDLSKRISGVLERAPASDEQQRFVGVSIAAAADNTLQNAYAIRLGSRFKSAIKDTANYYDAVYYLAYAMYGANQPAGLSGSGISAGMQRLLTGKSFNVGPDAINPTFKALATQGSTLHLQSTLGPPDFDAETGVRPIDGSVFCFERVGNTAKLLPDVLRYDRTAHALSGKSFPCISGFYQP